MAGHSHWKQIKIQKGVADEKRGRLFSKLLAAIAVAARREPNPQFNPRLRAAIAKAKESQVPQENIERAISRASTQSENMEELIVEAYGPAGSALIIEAITESSNRTMNNLRQIFKDHEAKLAAPGSVRWAFEKPDNENPEWRPKFQQELGPDEKSRLADLIEALKEQEDVQGVYTNAK